MNAFMTFGSVTWTPPLLEHELGELERTAEEWEVNFEKLMRAFREGKLEVLKDTDWRRMVNCDSRDPSWTIEEVRSHLEGKRDFERIERGLRRGGILPAPTVLLRKNHPPNLLGGNSRLLGCRALSIQPVIFRLDMEERGRKERIQRSFH
jgi:hypothetical protein